MPRTRCSRASSSTSGSAPRLVSRGLHVSGALARGVRGSGGFRDRLGGGLGVLTVRLGLGPALRSAVLRSAVLRGAVLGRAVLRRTVLGGLGCPGLGAAPALLLLFLGCLAGLALLGGGREALLLVRARLGRPEGALGSRFPGELLPVPGDLEQDADRVGGLR